MYMYMVYSGDRMDVIGYITTASLTTYLLTAFVLFVTYSYLSRKPWLNLPPGPTPIPIIGSLPFLMSDDIKKTTTNLRHKYGDIFTLHMGYETAVMLNGYDIIKEAFVTKQGCVEDRPDVYVLNSIGRRRAIGFSNGEVWKKHREQLMKFMRVFGYGQRGMAEVIQVEAERLVQRLKTLSSEPHYILQSLITSTCNVMSTVCFNKVYDHDDESHNIFLHNVHSISDWFGEPATFFPYLRFLPGDLFGFHKIPKRVDDILEYGRQQVKERKQRLKEGEEPIDVVGLYLQELDKDTKSGSSTVLSETELVHNIFCFYMDGSSTSSTVLTWAAMYMINYPDVQAKVYAEINEVIGDGRLPQLADQSKLHYTNAVLCEVRRHSDPGPLGVPHAASKDFTLRGYTIPKGMMVFAVQHSCHYDPNEWRNPTTFDPNHFLDDDGLFSPSSKLITFSMGPRNCFGQVLAKSELFVLFASMIQRFQLSTPDGAPKPNMEANIGFLYTPKPYKMCINER